VKGAAKGKSRLLTGIAAILVAALVGCVYTTRPYWWNFYNNGVSRASEGEMEEAAENFETAIGIREGATLARPKDARRVRTYGMHFIDDYFPHRELGLAYYRTKRFAEAEKELLISLDQTPSAKAKMYLNLVRGELLRREPAQEEPPDLTLRIPDRPYLSSDRMTLTGVAESRNRISSIFVNGQRLFVELAEEKTPFFTELRLKPGPNTVLVEAVDLVGKSSSKKLLLNVDMEFPAVAIEDAVRKGADAVAVSGIATDNLGISSLVVQGRRQAVEGPATEIPFRLEAARGDTISVEVADLAGNTTSARVTISPEMIEPGGGESSRPVLLAMRPTGRVLDSGGIRFASSEEATGGDRTPPIISLRNVTDGRVIYSDQLIFDGLVRDNGRLAVLSVNGEDVLGPKTGVLVKYFSYRASLSEGPNHFRVVAVDRAGNRAEQSFRVIRKIQEPLQVEARLTLALLPLQENGSVRSATSQVYGLLLGAFLERGRFNFVEREETVFRALLTELKIGNSELADKATAVRIGHLRTAEGMLYGKTIEDHRSLTVDLWLVDTETSEILFFADVYGEDKSRDELKWLMDGLVLKFVQRFPLVRGKVTRVTDLGVYIDNGLLDGIWTGTKYLILKEEPGAVPGALRMIKMDGKALVARAKTVQPESCFAAFADTRGAALVDVNDPVITK
jgi:hypothetical protein